MVQPFSDKARPGRVSSSTSGRCLWLVLGVCGSLLAAAGGCRRTTHEAAPPDPLVIPVSRPVSRQIVDYVYYTGRIDAVQSVDVRARVTGYLVKMPFREGAEIKAGDLLFEIDPRPYQAQYDAAKAQVELRDANYRYARSENLRSKAIARNVEGSVSPEALEKSQSQADQSLAQLNLAKASFDLAKLDLDFTKVISPIDGHISRYYYTLGNLVTQDQTVLTTVVSVDPMYAFFDVDERTVLRVRKAVNEGKIPMRKDIHEIPVNMGLEGEEGYPHKGNLNFFNNTVNPTTGTLTVRGVFPNPLPPAGRRLLTPGMFVRIQLPISPPHPAILVIDRALGSDQGNRFAYVVDTKNTIQYRRVKAGPLQDDGLRAIEEGLSPDDWVVISGLPQVQPNMVVEPERMTMPTLDLLPGREQTSAPTARPQPPPPGNSKR